MDNNLSKRIVCELLGLSNETPGSLQQPESADITTAGVIRLLQAVTTWQRANGAPLGCLNTNRIRLKDNQLVIALGGEQVSYSSVMKDDDEARFFAKVDREMPEPVDDLVALGVALGEHIIPPKKRPEISTDKKSYRKKLAKKLRVNFADLIVQRDHVSRNKLIRTLLTADQKRTQPQNFLKTHGPLLAHDHDGTLRTASVVDSLRNKTLLAVMTGLTLCLVAYFLFEKRTLQKAVQADTDVLRADLKTLKEEKAALQREKAALQEQNADLRTTSKTPGNSPPNEKKRLALETLTKHHAYRTFKSDANLENDQRFKELLRKPKITLEDYSYAINKLKTLTEAAVLWWQCVDQELSKPEILTKILKYPVPVQNAIKTWIADTVSQQRYELRLQKPLLSSNGWKDYDLRLTLYQTGGNLTDKDKDKEVDVRFNSSKSNTPAGILNIRWKGGNQLRPFLEYWTWWKGTNWQNLSDTNMRGYLSLHKLVRSGAGSDNGIKLNFQIVPNLPGPPRDSGQPISPFPRDLQDLIPDSQKPVDSSATPQSESIGDLKDGLAL